MGKLKKIVRENKKIRYVDICSYQLGFFISRHKQIRGRICFSLDMSIFIHVLIVFKIADRKIQSQEDRLYENLTQKIKYMNNI